METLNPEINTWVGLIPDSPSPKLRSILHKRRQQSLDKPNNRICYSRQEKMLQCTEWDDIQAKMEVCITWPYTVKPLLSDIDAPDSTESNRTLEYQDVSTAEALFKKLAEQWKKDTLMQSSISAVIMHPAYLDIIGMGEKALPLILRDLQKEMNHWFTALRAIAKTSPVNPKDAGNLRKMRKAWLKWGKMNGYLD